MVTTKERTEMREQLVGQGYSCGNIDAWQPKISLYLHAPKVNSSSEIIHPVGTKIENLPGSPDYVLRKSVLGMLPYPPSDTCECRWCAIRKVEVETVVEPVSEVVEESVTCQECSEEVSALTRAGALSRLRVHMKTHQGAE
jgi:hypothetical protein